MKPRELCITFYTTEIEVRGVIFWFRHWTWNHNETTICQITSRDEAVRFIREQFMKPCLFSGWNHVGLARFLPEVYGE
jgi:phenolic acid decarboxylase